MLDRMSGKITHIDFGDCFEVAMTREKFPEKIPFRLTRMLINAMEVGTVTVGGMYACKAVYLMCFYASSALDLSYNEKPSMFATSKFGMFYCHFMLCFYCIPQDLEVDLPNHILIDHTCNFLKMNFKKAKLCAI